MDQEPPAAIYLQELCWDGLGSPLIAICPCGATRCDCAAPWALSVSCPVRSPTSRAFHTAPSHLAAEHNICAKSPLGPEYCPLPLTRDAACANRTRKLPLDHPLAIRRPPQHLGMRCPCGAARSAPALHQSLQHLRCARAACQNKRTSPGGGCTCPGRMERNGAWRLEAVHHAFVGGELTLLFHLQHTPSMKRHTHTQKEIGECRLRPLKISSKDSSALSAATGVVSNGKGKV